ncbi:hypothetical protein KUCAC02_013965, partial [Chaenocephalus aceratus]
SHPSLKPTCVTLFDRGSSTCFCRQPLSACASTLLCRDPSLQNEANFSQAILDDVSGRRKKMELTSRAPHCYAGLDMLLTKFAVQRRPALLIDLSEESSEGPQQRARAWRTETKGWVKDGTRWRKMERETAPMGPCAKL